MKSILKYNNLIRFSLLNSTVLIGVGIFCHNIQIISSNISQQQQQQYHSRNKNNFLNDNDDNNNNGYIINEQQQQHGQHPINSRSSRRRIGIVEPSPNTINNNEEFNQVLKNGLARLIGLDEENAQNLDTSHYDMPIFPNKPGNKMNQIITKTHSGMAMDEHGRVQMGVSSVTCDDAKTNLTMDWDLSPVNYTCFHPETRFPFDTTKSYLWECENVPSDYSPNHFCMDQHIEYQDLIPTVGDHRPLWPVYGEYTFVPRQRWLHNIEHGAVIMLYHPCAEPEEVKRLKYIVTSCFDKHVITPSTLVPAERPLVLVAWGCKLLMATVDDNIVLKFIQEKAMNGPEDTIKQGQYNLGLIKGSNDTGTGQFNVIKCTNH